MSLFDEINKLKEDRAKLLVDQRAIIDKADAEKRDLTAEEKQQYDTMDTDFQSITDEIREKEADFERREKLKMREDLSGRPDFRQNLDDNNNDEQRDAYDTAFSRALRWGRGALDAPEVRALQVGTDSEGGYLVPDEFHKSLVEAKVVANVMRGLCTVIPTGSGTREIPVVSSEGAAAWTAEEGSFNESDDEFGQVTLSAYKATRIIKVSEELVHDSFFNIMAHLAGSFGRSIGQLEEAAMVSGDGSGKPTGIVGALATGVTAVSATAITSDEMIDLFHSLPRQYRMNANFMMADGTAKIVRKLKDGNSQYLWQPGLQAGQPDNILSRPVAISDNVPAATTGLDAIAFADFSYYWIADREKLAMKLLNELYAANGQVGFRGYSRVDGKMTLPAAGRVLTMG